MENKTSSILDYPHPGLPSSIWTEAGLLRADVKDFILGELDRFFSEQSWHAKPSGVRGSWVDGVYVVGSLTTYQYLNDSDLDVHVGVDLDKFIIDERPDLTKQQASVLLDELRKQYSKRHILLPGAQHPVELYFESELNRKAASLGSGRYDVVNDVWVDPPKDVPADFDVSRLVPALLDIAEKTAKEVDGKLGFIDRSIKRIEELSEVLKEWPPATRQLFKQKIQEHLSAVESEIRGLLVLKQRVTDARRVYDPLSEQEITFKYLARFGYLALLSDLKDFLDDNGVVTQDEVEEIKEIVEKKASVQRSALFQKYWLSPEGQEFEVDSKRGHLAWIEDNVSLLKARGENVTDVDGAADALIESGWVRVTNSTETSTSSDFGVEVASFSRVPSIVDDFVSKHFTGKPFEMDDLDGNYLVISDPFPNVQKAVLRSMKTAKMWITPRPVVKGEEALIVSSYADDVLQDLVPDTLSLDYSAYKYPSVVEWFEAQEGNFYALVHVDLVNKATGSKDAYMKLAVSGTYSTDRSRGLVVEDVDVSVDDFGKSDALEKEGSNVGGPNPLNAPSGDSQIEIGMDLYKQVGEYPYRYSKRPTGDNFSNFSNVMHSLVTTRKTAYTNQEMNSIIQHQVELVPTDGNDSVFYEWQTDGNVQSLDKPHAVNLQYPDAPKDRRSPYDLHPYDSTWFLSMPK